MSAAAQRYGYTRSVTDASVHDYAATGGYPIGLVSTLTGLSVDVIRAWERRYGLPRPARTMGGHRLYRPRDVALLRRAAALRAQGLTAAAACAQALAEATQAPPVPETIAGSALTERLSDRLHDAAATLDAAQAGAVLSEAGALLDVATLWRQIMAPALNRLGTDWAHGTLTPAPEHLLSSLVRGRLWALLEAIPRLPGAPGALLGAAPGERHDLPPLMLALLLSRAGWAVTYLGADTPAEAWEEAVRTLQPRLIVVTATMPEYAEAALETLRRVRDRFGGQSPDLAYGGPAFASAALPAHEAETASFTHLTGDLEAAARQLAAFA